MIVLQRGLWAAQVYLCPVTPSASSFPRARAGQPLMPFAVTARRSLMGAAAAAVFGFVLDYFDVGRPPPPKAQGAGAAAQQSAAASSSSSMSQLSNPVSAPGGPPPDVWTSVAQAQNAKKGSQ